MGGGGGGRNMHCELASAINIMFSAQQSVSKEWQLWIQ
jgi:hypothetical protein